MKTKLMVIKDRIGAEAVKLIQSGMIVGLGSGSTAAYFIKHLARRCKEGLDIQAVSSSEKSTQLASHLKIPLIPIDTIESVDLTIDGADQINPAKQMIKGLGGALVREKILAHMSREMVIIVDESKLVPQLGKLLPTEIIPFAHMATLSQLKRLGYHGEWRKKPDGSYFISDNHNFILDIRFDHPIENPLHDHEKIISLPGVVETGFFFNLAGRIIIGFLDGQIITRE